MKLLIEALNHPAAAFRKKNKVVSFGLVIFTILVNAILEPVLEHFFGVVPVDIQILHMIKIVVLGVLAYLVICSVFWLVCRIFGSKKSLTDHICAWGITFAPTALCSVVVAFTEVFFFIFWNSTIWGMLLNIVFVAILIWKTILYFIYLREYAQLKGWRFFTSVVLIAIIILILAALNGYVGLITPIL